MAIQKHKRIFYPAGFISLLVLPWLCLWHLNEEKRLVFQEPRAMEIFMPDVKAKPNSMFSIYNFPKRKNHTITLTGNNNEDKVKLIYIQLELRRILKENDSINGLHVTFSDSAKYWTMIKLFDICNIENFPRYYLLQNDFFAAHVPEKNDMIQFTPICGGVFNPELANQARLKEKKERQSEENQRKIEIQNKIKLFFWPSSLIFISMIFLSFRQLYFLWKN